MSEVTQRFHKYEMTNARLRLEISSTKQPPIGGILDVRALGRHGTPQYPEHDSHALCTRVHTSRSQTTKLMSRTVSEVKDR